MSVHGAPAQQRNGLGTAGFVLGLLAAIFAWIPFIGVIAWPLAILGLILSALGLWRVVKRRADNRGMAIAGLVLSAIGLLFCIIYAVSFAGAVNDLDRDLNQQGTVSGAGAAPAEAPAADTASVAQAGQDIDVGGLVLTTTAVESQSQDYGPTQLCTTASYRNGTGEQAAFNALDWKLQTPSGQILTSGITFGGDALNSGQLAPGGTAEGQVCWDAAAETGEYRVNYAGSMLSSGPQASWTTTR